MINKKEFVKYLTALKHLSNSAHLPLLKDSICFRDESFQVTNLDTSAIFPVGCGYGVYSVVSLSGLIAVLKASMHIPDNTHLSNVLAIKGGLSLVFGDSHVTIPIKGASVDYPEIMAEKLDDVQTYPSFTIQDVVNCKSFVSSDSSRGVIQYVMFPENGEYCVATTGHVVYGSKNLANTPMVSFEDTRLIDPIMIKGLSSLCSKKEREVFFPTIIGGSNCIRFTIKGIRFECRTKEETYPHVGKCIPSEYSKNVSMDRKGLIKILKALKPQCDKKTQLVQFRFNIRAGNSLDISVINTAAVRTTTAESFFTPLDGDIMNDGFLWEIGFNVSHLISLLSCLDDNTVTIRMNTAVGLVAIGDRLGIMPLRCIVED